MHRNQMRCRPISRIPVHAQTTLQVKTETMVTLMTSVSDFLTGAYDLITLAATSTVGTIASAWQFGSKRSQGE